MSLTRPLGRVRTTLPFAATCWLDPLGKGAWPAGPGPGRAPGTGGWLALGLPIGAVGVRAGACGTIGASRACGTVGARGRWARRAIRPAAGIARPRGWRRRSGRSRSGRSWLGGRGWPARGCRLLIIGCACHARTSQKHGKNDCDGDVFHGPVKHWHRHCVLFSRCRSELDCRGAGTLLNVAHFSVRKCHLHVLVVINLFRPQVGHAYWLPKGRSHLVDRFAKRDGWRRSIDRRWQGRDVRRRRWWGNQAQERLPAPELPEKVEVLRPDRLDRLSEGDSTVSTSAIDPITLSTEERPSCSGRKSSGWQ